MSRDTELLQNFKCNAKFICILEGRKLVWHLLWNMVSLCYFHAVISNEILFNFRNLARNVRKNLTLLPRRLQSKLPLPLQKQYISIPTEHSVLSQHLYGGTEEYHINLSQNNQIIGQDFNLRSPEYVTWKYPFNWDVWICHCRTVDWMIEFDSSQEHWDFLLQLSSHWLCSFPRGLLLWIMDTIGFY
jgi:hypothetical protein